MSRLIVSRLSRLGRNSREVLEIARQVEAKGASLVVTAHQVDTSTAMGRFFFTLMAAVAELESDANSEHMREMVAHIRSKGRVWGRTPFGWDRSGMSLVPNDFERAIWRKAKLLQKRGLTGNQIAEALARTAARNREGEAFSRSQVYHLLKLDFSENPTVYVPPSHYRRTQKRRAR